MDYRIAGAMLNSALYLTAVFVASIVSAHPVAMVLSIVAFGVTYLSYFAQALLWVDLGRALVLLSIVVGLMAGLNLLF